MALDESMGRLAWGVIYCCLAYGVGRLHEKVLKRGYAPPHKSVASAAPSAPAAPAAPSAEAQRLDQIRKILRSAR